MERTIIRTDRLGGMTRSYYSDQLDGVYIRVLMRRKRQ